MTPTKRTFQNKAGKWVERSIKTEILLCSSCGTKYIKTRTDQVVCIRCIYRVTQTKA